MSKLNQCRRPVVNRAKWKDHPQTETGTAIAPVPAWKRILDVTLVIIAIPFVIPAGVIVYIFITIVSPGPAFFRQQRVGRGRRLFTCLKFRTMKLNADTGVHQRHLTQLMAANQPTRKLDWAGDIRVIFGGK